MIFASILYRYIAKHFIVSFIAIMALFCGLILLFDSIELLRRAASNENIPLTKVFQMAFLKFPQMIHTLLPFAIMATTTIVLWRLSRSNELVAVRAVGVSAWHFMLPLIVITLLIGILNILVANPIASSMYKQYEVMQDSLKMRFSNPLFISFNGVWLRDSIDESVLIINSKLVTQKNDSLTLNNPTFIVTDKKNQFLKRIEAKEAFLSNDSFTLSSPEIFEIGKKSVKLPSLTMKTNLSVKKINENFASPESISFWDLKEFISFFKKSGFSAHKHLLYYNSLIASPLLLCATAILAAAFSLSPNQRQVKVITRVVIGISVGFMFFFITRVTYALGISGILPILLSVWTPVFIFIMLGISVILHIEDG